MSVFENLLLERRGLRVLLSSADGPLTWPRKESLTLGQAFGLATPATLYRDINMGYRFRGPLRHRAVPNERRLYCIPPQHPRQQTTLIGKSVPRAVWKTFPIAMMTGRRFDDARSTFFATVAFLYHPLYYGAKHFTSYGSQWMQHPDI